MVFIGQEQLYQFAYDLFIFLLIIILTAIVATISKVLIDKAMKSSSPHLVERIKQSIFVLIWAVGLILGISQVGISIDILILLVGLAGIGFIVSALHGLQNFVSRSFLNLQMQYKVGDVISIKNFCGKVIEITDLNTVLLDKDGKLIAVPNVQFLKEIWVKHSSVSAGYEMTIPIVINKEIDAVNFEKGLLSSIKDLKYFKKEASIVTSKTDEKIIELSLILNLKDPEKKCVVTVEINEIITKLIAEFTERAEKERKEAKLKEIKDISQ
ncbi:Mechanosensitive ion channel [uncultured archaeon]|nr:Mechanosensitive ion channel [uncultured archaeon]